MAHVQMLKPFIDVFHCWSKYQLDHDISLVKNFSRRSKIRGPFLPKTKILSEDDNIQFFLLFAPKTDLKTSKNSIVTKKGVFHLIQANFDVNTAKLSI